APFAVGCRPSPARSTPALVISSMYLPIAASNASLGMTPASVFLSALRRIMNRIAVSPGCGDIAPRTPCGPSIRQTSSGRLAIPLQAIEIEADVSRLRRRVSQRNGAVERLAGLFHPAQLGEQGTLDTVVVEVPCKRLRQRLHHRQRRGGSFE